MTTQVDEKVWSERFTLLQRALDDFQPLNDAAREKIAAARAQYERTLEFYDALPRRASSRHLESLAVKSSQVSALLLVARSANLHGRDIMEDR